MKKNKLIVLLTVFVLVFSLQAAAASTTKEKAAVRETVTSFLKNTKNYNNKNIVNMMLPSKKDIGLSLFDKNSYIDKSIRKIHEGSFKYKISKVKVSGKTAKVVVNVTYYDGKNTFIDSFNNAVNDIVNNNLDYSDKLVLKKFYKYSLEDYKKHKKQYTKTVKSTIPLKKYNGEWKISKVTKQMTAYINCNYVAGFNYVQKLYE